MNKQTLYVRLCRNMAEEKENLNNISYEIRKLFPCEKNKFNLRQTLYQSIKEYGKHTCRAMLSRNKKIQDHEIFLETKPSLHLHHRSLLHPKHLLKENHLIAGNKNKL